MGKAKQTVLGIVFQVLIMALCIQFGVISPSNSFVVNIVASIIIVVVTKVLSMIFG